MSALDGQTIRDLAMAIVHAEGACTIVIEG
jgi:hypothetical protein